MLKCSDCTDSPTRRLTNVSSQFNFYLYLLIPPLYIVAGYQTISRFLWFENQIQAAVDKQGVKEEDAASYVAIVNKLGLYVEQINNNARSRQEPEMDVPRINALLKALQTNDESNPDVKHGSSLFKTQKFATTASSDDFMEWYERVKPKCHNPECEKSFSTGDTMFSGYNRDNDAWRGHGKGTPCCSRACLEKVNKSKWFEH